MFSYFLAKLDAWIERLEQRRCADFISNASDLADLERRMRAIERYGYEVCCSQEP
jgi:hypothetical protein